MQQVTPQEFQKMRQAGDTRGPGEIRKLVAQGIDPRADSPAFAQVNPEPTTSTATPAPAPAQPKPAASSQSSNPAPLSEQQAQVLRSVMGGQARASAPQPQAGGDFIALVDAHQQHHGCKRSEAIGAVATENPELHRQWLIAQQPGDPAPAAQTPGQKAAEHEFMAQAKRLSAEQSMPLSKAMSEVARQKPDLHKQFLRDVQ